jgi:penicillin V acylase-like amidase (Ntn superfamily)
MKCKSKAIRGILSCADLGRLFRLMAVFIAVFQVVDPAFPCSAVYRKTTTQQQQMGANFDWNAKGGIAFLSPRQQAKSAGMIVAGKGRPAKWVSRYASLTLSQFGRDYPMQGINEAGLAGAVLMAPAQYPTTGPAGDITENLWLQYQLDRFATVNDVVLHAGDFGIHKISADLHWMLCDKTGECAAVEYIDGRPHIYRSRDQIHNILTNSPYAAVWQSYVDWSASNRPLPQGYQSSARFIRLAFSQNSPSLKTIEDTLDDVALAGFTAWQTVFDLSSHSLKVRVEGGSWESITFDFLNLNCSENLPIYKLSSGGWTPYDGRLVESLIQRATVGIPREEASLIIEAKQLSETISCPDLESH